MQKAGEIDGVSSDGGREGGREEAGAWLALMAQTHGPVDRYRQILPQVYIYKYIDASTQVLLLLTFLRFRNWQRWLCDCIHDPNQKFPFFMGIILQAH